MLCLHCGERDGHKAWCRETVTLESRVWSYLAMCRDRGMEPKLSVQAKAVLKWSPAGGQGE